MRLRFFKEGFASCAEGVFVLGIMLEMGTARFLRWCQWSGVIRNILRKCPRTRDHISCSFKLPQKQSYKFMPLESEILQNPHAWLSRRTCASGSGRRSDDVAISNQWDHTSWLIRVT